MMRRQGTYSFRDPVIINHHSRRHARKPLGTGRIDPQPFGNDGLEVGKTKRRGRIDGIERGIGAADFISQFTIGFRVGEEVESDCGEESGDGFTASDTV